MLTKLLICLINKTTTKIIWEELYFYAYVVSITTSFLVGEILHCWSGSEFGFALWSSIQRRWNLRALCLTGIILFWISLKFSPCIPDISSTDGFLSLSYHPLLFYSPFGRSMILARYFSLVRTVYTDQSLSVSPQTGWCWLVSQSWTSWVCWLNKCW